MDHSQDIFIRPFCQRGTELLGSWQTETLLTHQANAIGSSCTTCVKSDGSKAFLKVNWIQKPNTGPEHFKTSAFRYAFEVELLRYLTQAQFSGIGKILAAGPVTDTHGNTFNALAFELGDANADLSFNTLPPDLLWWFAAHFMQISHTVANLHQHGIIHRDLTPSNILLMNDRTRTVLTDFGSAFWLNHPSPTDVLKVTTPYHLSPPERYVFRDWTSRWQKLTAIELWQVGSLIYQAIVGDTPLRPLLGRRFTNLERLEEGSFRKSPELEKQVANGFKDACRILSESITQKVSPAVHPQARVLFDIFKSACHPDPAKRGHPKLAGAGPDQRYRLDPYVEDLAALVKDLKRINTGG